MMFPKIFVLGPGEDWIVDRWVSEWQANNPDLSTNDPSKSDVIWLLADWCWQHVPLHLLASKKVVVTVHHIVPEKMSPSAVSEFKERDRYVDVYHVPCDKTKRQISCLTSKEIVTILPWVNGDLWRRRDNEARVIRNKLNIPQRDAGSTFVIGSFQRDTEGKDLTSPKLEKGPDRFCDVVEEFAKTMNVTVLLGGWRRQYVMKRLGSAKIDYKYIERPPLETISEMYSAIDLYVVAARYEGGPQSIIECAATRTPIISTDVGFAADILSPKSIFDGDKPSTALLAAPDVTVAYDNVSRLFMPFGFEPFRNFFIQRYGK